MFKIVKKSTVANQNELINILKNSHDDLLDVNYDLLRENLMLRKLIE